MESNWEKMGNKRVMLESIQGLLGSKMGKLGCRRVKWESSSG